MRLIKTPRFFQWIFPGKTWGFSHSDNTIYLTFDDGPDPQITPWILDLLSESGWKATFFCVGNQAKKYPELLERIRKEGHSVGNHSMYHEKGINTPLKRYVQSVELADTVLKTRLFRPPYGRMTLAQTFALRKEGYKIIMWSWLSYDFDRELNEELIKSNMDRIRKGDILVFHDNAKTADRVKILLPYLIEKMSEKGFRSYAIAEKEGE